MTYLCSKHLTNKADAESTVTYITTLLLVLLASVFLPLFTPVPATPLCLCPFIFLCPYFSSFIVFPLLYFSDCLEAPTDSKQTSITGPLHTFPLPLDIGMSPVLFSIESASKCYLIREVLVNLENCIEIKTMVINQSSQSLLLCSVIFHNTYHINLLFPTCVSPYMSNRTGFEAGCILLPVPGSNRPIRCVPMHAHVCTCVCAHVLLLLYMCCVYVYVCWIEWILAL